MAGTEGLVSVSRRLDIFLPGHILRAMKRTSRKTLAISLRLRDGWSKKVQNKDPKKCDIDGARLWIGPGGQIYCDLIHDIPAQSQYGARSAQAS